MDKNVVHGKTGAAWPVLHCVKAVHSQLLNGSNTRVCIVYVRVLFLDSEKIFRRIEIKRYSINR